MCGFDCQIIKISPTEPLIPVLLRSWSEIGRNASAGLFDLVQTFLPTCIRRLKIRSEDVVHVEQMNLDLG